VTKLNLGRNAEVLLAERGLVLPALMLGLAAGLSVFFCLKHRYAVVGWTARGALLVGSLLAGLVVVPALVLGAGAVHPGFGWTWAGLVLVGVLLASYRFGPRGTSGGGAALLTVLRLLAIGVLVVLYFEPELKLVNRSERRSKLLLLVDRSGSMKINDGPDKARRLDWVKYELLGGDGVVSALEEDFELDFFAFAERLDELEAEELGTLEPTGRATTFAPTVGEACSKADKLTTVGALVFTDGIDNSGRDPVKPIAEAALPVFPVAVGSKLREKGDFKDIAVSRVDYERYVAANNKTEITAHLEGVGLNGRRVAVVLWFDEKEKDRQTLVLDDFPGTQSVTLSFTPEETGTFTCSVAATEDPDERITDNNRKDFDLIVTDPAIKVLLVEGVIRAEYKWLVRTLQMDPNVSLLALVQVRRDVFNQQGNVKDIRLTGFPRDIETLKKFDVVMFSDIDRSFFTTEQLRNVRTFVEDGGGFLMLGGYSALGPGGYADTPAAEVLPVELGDKEIGQEKDPFRLRLTPDGAAHSILSGITEFFDADGAAAKRTLPPLWGCTRVGALKPGATRLAVHPGRTGPGGEPLVVAAVQQYGRGRTMVFTADTTWRWYLGLRGLGRETPYIRFWGQAIRWLAGQEPKEEEAEPGLTAYTDRRYYEPGSTVRIYARVRDTEGQATNQANVTALISGPVGSPATRQVPYLPGSTGKYEVDFHPAAPGAYKMLVKAETLEGPIGAAELAFRVGRPNLEFDKLDLGDAMLKRLAERTGGKYVTLVGLNNFVRSLKSTEQAKSTVTRVDVWSDEMHVTLPVVGRIDFSLYLVIAFAVFTALVTAEWVLRRRRQLT
jgi:uncharacterized membrane protein